MLFVPIIEVRVVVSCISPKQIITIPPTCYSPNDITLTDSSLNQTPKLKDALDRANTMPSNISGTKLYSVSFNKIEFDTMSKMLISTGEGKDMAKRSLYSNPNQILWPNPSNVVFVNYQRNEYQIIVDSPLPLDFWWWY